MILLLFYLALDVSAFAADCPTDFIEIEQFPQKCYYSLQEKIGKYNHFNTTFKEAISECKRRGSQLFEPASVDEAKVVSQRFSRYVYTMTVWYWTGYYRFSQMIETFPDKWMTTAWLSQLSDGLAVPSNIQVSVQFPPIHSRQYYSEKCIGGLQYEPYLLPTSCLGKKSYICEYFK
ncbi:uncharacterized protein LOC142338514 [Convolutriloba macropyga]|uniref:uncharacterized protein LOC142338514 n=1 Tax=Convolutriloba macropyga TaxID=536237 RepID=UPI003F528016